MYINIKHKNVSMIDLIKHIQVTNLINCLNFITVVIYQFICSIYCQAEKPALSLPMGSRSP